MAKFCLNVVKYRKLSAICFMLAFGICLLLSRGVSVNYDFNDYLPDDAPSTISTETMRIEFKGAIPNARIMIDGVTIPQALEFKEKIKAVPGVTEVIWLDDAANLGMPLSMSDEKTLAQYYADNSALFTVAIEDGARIEAINQIRGIVGQNAAISGNAASTAAATMNTVAEIQKITIISILFVFFILFLTTSSWLYPLIIMAGLGVAIVLNNGSNIMFGEISFVTNAAGSILQLAVSLDYSVFLIHRFDECRKQTPDFKKAMAAALYSSASSILSSGLTTVIGFLALVLMRFKIGPDLGLALAKGVGISLVTVFLFLPAITLFAEKLILKTEHRQFTRPLTGFGKFALKIAKPVVVIFLIAAIPAFLASGKNAFYYGSSHIYGAGTQYGDDMQKIEDKFGLSDTYALLVPKGDAVSETMLSADLKNIAAVESVVSYVDTVGAEIPDSYLDEQTYSKLRSDNYSRFIITVNSENDGEGSFELVRRLRGAAAKYYGEDALLAGQGAAVYDLMETVTDDTAKVNFIAIAAVFIVLLFTTKSVVTSAILVGCIEGAIWLNLSVPYFMEEHVYYIAYLIISSVQLGATVDYAILLAERYKENRASMNTKQAASGTVAGVMPSIMTSGSALTVVGLMLGAFSTNGLLAQLGTLIGRGAIFSIIVVLLVLPGFLTVFDRFVVGKNY